MADPGFSRRGCGTGGLGTEVPQRGPGAEPRWGLGAKPPEARDIMLNSKFTTQNKRKLKYKEISNTTKT